MKNKITVFLSSSIILFFSTCQKDHPQTTQKNLSRSLIVSNWLEKQKPNYADSAVSNLIESIKSAVINSVIDSANINSSEKIFSVLLKEKKGKESPAKYLLLTETKNQTFKQVNIIEITK